MRLLVGDDWAQDVRHEVACVGVSFGIGGPTMSVS